MTENINKTALKIPIIILNWNGLADTIECIDSVLKQTYTNFEVYLLDNGSAIEEVQALKEKYQNKERINLILNTENVGFTKGNNQIFQEYILPNSSYEFVVLLNNDTFVPNDWLTELVSTATTEKVDMVSCKMINYFERKVMDNAGHRMLNTGEILPIGNGENVKAFNETFKNLGPCGGAALYSTKMLKEIGIFDDYFNTGYEDAELGLRGVVLGYESIFAPKAIVYHKVSRSINKIRDFDYTLKIQLDIFYTCLKILPLPVLILNFPFFVFKILMIFGINIVFRRWKFLRILTRSLYLILFKQWGAIRKKRKAFFANKKTLTNWQILRKQEFFLLFDIKRFFKHIVFKEEMVFEKY